MLEKICVLRYKMHLQSGLHIGGSDDVFDIGGADSTVIRNPLDNKPYIPGSSIKGKMRSLLSRKYGSIENGKVVLEDETLLNLFSPIENAKPDTFAATRCVFRDALLTEESSERLQSILGAGNYTEIKGENSINPLSGTADNPRFIERVPAGVDFEGEIVLQVYSGDNEKVQRDFLEEGLSMLALNYIGGSGSRGYGRIEITDQHFEEV